MFEERQKKQYVILCRYDVHDFVEIEQKTNRKKSKHKIQKKSKKYYEYSNELEWWKTLSTVFSLTICLISSYSVVAFPSSVFNDNDDVYEIMTRRM